MNAKHPSVFEELKQIDALVDLQREPQLPVEHLPFTVRLVKTEEDLMKAVKVRYEGYSKHMPAASVALLQPEPEDYEPDTAILLAESKLDGEPIASVRVQTNEYRPLHIELAMQMPRALQGKRLADARRLSIVRGGEGGLVRAAMFKALFTYWQVSDVDWAVVAARAPMNRTYERLLFRNLLTDPGFWLESESPKSDYITALGLPHFALGFDIGKAEATWRQVNHPLLKFVVETYHPDITVGSEMDLVMPDVPHGQTIGATVALA